MSDERVAALLEPVLAHHGLELEEVEVVPAGSRRVVRVVVDGDGPKGRGPLLDDIAAASSMLSAALDASDVMGSRPYTLEVSSRGVSRPLLRPAHWRRNRGRLVLASLVGGDQVLGRVVVADESTVSLEVDGDARTVALADVTKAMVQVELNRRRSDDDDLDGSDDDQDDADQDDEQDDEQDDDEQDDEQDPTTRQD